MFFVGLIVCDGQVRYIFSFLIKIYENKEVRTLVMFLGFLLVMHIMGYEWVYIVEW